MLLYVMFTYLLLRFVNNTLQEQLVGSKGKVNPFKGFRDQDKLSHRERVAQQNFKLSLSDPVCVSADGKRRSDEMLEMIFLCLC